MGIQVAGSLPAGSIVNFAGATPPAGWLFCSGQAVSRATYAALFLAIGTAYGAGDGSTTFNLPDARGRSLFGKDDMGGAAANRLTTGGSGVNGAALGAAGGGETVTLAEAQMPAHTHLFDAAAATATTGSYIERVNKAISGHSSLINGQTAGMLAKGSSAAHSNMPPALVSNVIIKT